MNKYKVILFDMDGTIADTDDMILSTWHDLYDLYSKSGRKADEDIIYFSGPPLFETLHKEFPTYDIDFLLKEYDRIATPYYKSKIKLFPFEIESLDYLINKGYRLAVVTNKNKEKTHFVLNLLGISKYFDYVVTSSDIKIQKPNPEGILLALGHFNLSSKDAIYIGDNDIDYFTSKNANMDCLICAWGPRKLNVLDKVNYVIHSFKEIIDIL